ncbi:SIP domain-containing protein, partial [Streptomyces europaeiscabiei]
PSHILAIGDPASLPALNSLLDALPSAPATIWFETSTETETEEEEEEGAVEVSAATAAMEPKADTDPARAASEAGRDLEAGRASEAGGASVAGGLPLRLDPTRHDFRPVPREDAGARLLTQVRTDAPALLENTPAPYVWIACDTATTRSLTAYFRKELGLPKHRMHALGYWRP